MIPIQAAPNANDSHSGLPNANELHSGALPLCAPVQNQVEILDVAARHSAKTSAKISGRFAPNYTPVQILPSSANFTA